MLAPSSFAPRWASPPGDTIRDVLDERELTSGDLADGLGWAEERVTRLLDGAEGIDLETARVLAGVVGGSTQFWMTREAQYHEDQSRLVADAWAASLPTKDMRSFGWLPKTDDWIARIDACLQYFDVPDVASWNSSYGRMLSSAKFRTSAKTSTSDVAVATWLRQGEIQSRSLSAARWSPEALRSSLGQLRALTRIKDPVEFIPKLTELCGVAGVLVAVVRSPSGCPASGVARFLDGRTPFIALSGRYLSDDHFWFTFFHEVGHVLLHGAGEIYVDEFSQQDDESTTGVELEADRFAEEILFPPHLRSAVPTRKLAARDVVRLAHEAGVSPGVVVGQLQFSGRLGFHEMNYLKRRFRWSGTSLEMA